MQVREHDAHGFFVSLSLRHIGHSRGITGSASSTRGDIAPLGGVPHALQGSIFYVHTDPGDTHVTAVGGFGAREDQVCVPYSTRN